MQKKNSTFMFWNLIMRYETLILIFNRAHRENKFSLYVEVLEELTPLYFALDHVNYSRWIPFHIRDMTFLPDPIKDEFEKRVHWVLSKTSNKFSSIPIDQAHEQHNECERLRWLYWTNRKHHCFQALDSLRTRAG